MKAKRINPATPRRPHRRQRGVAIMEAVLASMILAISIVALAGALTAGAQISYAAADTRRAAELAEAMIEEILALPYEDPDGASALGPDAGETSRSHFDNMDDYHGYTEAAGATSDATGAAYPAAYGDLARSVTISTSSLQPSGFADAVDGITIQVDVTMNGGTLISLQRFVAEPASSS